MPRRRYIIATHKLCRVCSRIAPNQQQFFRGKYDPRAVPYRCHLPHQPHSPPPPGARLQVEGEGWSECARRGLAVKAVKGNALLFYSLKPNGVEDNASTHGSCPTLAGEKWSATR